MPTCDVAIIGAGIAGAACAYELASAGLRVAIVEPDAVGSGETAAGYGALLLAHESAAHVALTKHGLELWDMLAEQFPVDCDYRQQETLWLVSAEDRMKDAIRRWDFLHRHGVDAELLDHRQVVEDEPSLQPIFAGGLLVKSGGSIQPAKAAAFLLQLALSNSAQLHAQSARAVAGRQVILADESILWAGNIVIAAGQASPSLAPGIAFQYSKGHLLVVETDERCAHRQLSAFDLEPDPLAGIRLQIRQSGSQVWIGSSYQKTAPLPSAQVEPKVVAKLLRAAIETVPAIGRARPSRNWAASRAITPGGLPLIGRVPGSQSIFTATAFGDYGVTAALAAARLIADEILCRPPHIDPAPYLANRFEGNHSNHAE